MPRIRRAAPVQPNSVMTKITTSTLRDSFCGSISMIALMKFTKKSGKGSSLGSWFSTEARMSRIGKVGMADMNSRMRMRMPSMVPR